MSRIRLQATISTLMICALGTWSAADDLKVLEKEVCGKAFAVTGTGVVWAFVPEGPPRFHEGKRVSATRPLFLGYDDDLQAITKPPAENRIAFFDRGKWNVVPWSEALYRRDRNGPSGRIVAGVDNTVLVVGRETSLLIRGAQVVDHGELLSLIERHRGLICKSFGVGVPHVLRRDRWRHRTMIVAEDKGPIWCLHNETLHVLVGDSWLDCRKPLIDAGSRYGSIDFIMPGPDHRYLYIGDNKLRHDGGVSFLATIEGKDIVFKPTHHAINGMGHYPALREQNDAIWIASPEGKAGGVSDHFTGQSAVRVNRNGKVTNILRMSGYPLVSDPIGNIWLGGIRGGPKNQFNIVRNGKIVQKLEAPTSLEETSHNRAYLPIFCDSKGSVFVHTERGLAHFVAEEKSPHHYRMTASYALDKSKGVPQAFSSQGYCISLVAGDDVPLKLMHLTKVP